MSNITVASISEEWLDAPAAVIPAMVRLSEAKAFDDDLTDEVVNSQAAALKLAKLLGCTGAHKMEKGWHPCESHEGLQTLIKKGAAGYRAWKRTRKLGKAKGYTDVSDAIAEANRLGKTAIRAVVVNGEKVFKPV